MRKPLQLCGFRVTSTCRGSVFIASVIENKVWKEVKQNQSSSQRSARREPPPPKCGSNICFVPLQFRVPRGRASPPGAGQAGEDRLPSAVHDRRGPDAGVVPPPGDGVIRAIGVENGLLGVVQNDGSLVHT